MSVGVTGVVYIIDQPINKQYVNLLFHILSPYISEIASSSTIPRRKEGRGL